MGKRPTKSKRSTLTKEDARQRYVELGEIAVLQQIRKDARLLEDDRIAIGPFARLDAGAVAAFEGKTRGAVTNLFGSQAAFQAQTMAMALSVGPRLEDVDHPEPADFDDAEAWLAAFLAAQSARGPQHGTDPAADYGSLWALWLSAVPYGLWSPQISMPSMDEYAQSVRHFENIFARAIEHFGLKLRHGVRIVDLASALASLIEGIWLNQCLTTRHPCDPEAPIADHLRRSGQILWAGAVTPANAACGPNG